MATLQTQNKMETAHELAEAGRERVNDVTSRAAEAFDNTSTAVGRRMESAGTAIESAAQRTGESVREAGRYMQSSDPSTMRDDFVQLMGRHPGLTLCIGVGTGVALGAMFRQRPRDRR